MPSQNTVFQIIIFIACLVFLIIAILFTYRANRLSLPIATFESFLSILVPFVTYILIQQPFTTAWRARLESIAPYILVVLNTVLLTLATDGIASEAGCEFRAEWQDLYQTKNEKTIRYIQDSMQCCGYQSTHDMAWPFQDGTHDERACETTFGRTTACKGEWIHESNRIRSFRIALGVLGLVAVAMMIFFNQQSHRRYADIEAPEARSLLANGPDSRGQFLTSGEQNEETLSDTSIHEHYTEADGEE